MSKHSVNNHSSPFFDLTEVAIVDVIFYFHNVVILKL